MLKKFLISASVAGLMVGAAAAVELENYDGAIVEEPYPLASALDFAGGAVVSAANELEVGFGPSAGAFPTGNVLIYVTVTGGTFDGALDGSEVEGVGTSVISSGGANGGTEVTFLVSGADGCAIASGAGAGTSDCNFDIPLELDGSDVSYSVGLTTDAGAPVDNSSATNRVSLQVVDITAAFDIDIVADANPTTALLASAPVPFSLLDTVGTADDILGTYEVGTNAITYAAMVARPVNRDLAGTAVSAADVLSVDLVASGTMDAFDPANGGDFEFDGVSADSVDATADEAEYDAVVDFGTGAVDVTVLEDGTTPVARSGYSLSVTVVPAVASPLTAGTTSTGPLQAIERDGTQITFPWTQTSTQGAASGTVSVYRIGNLDSTDAGAVFVEAKNASAAGYTNPGIVQLATSIDANGELTTNSTSVEAALGNYGRGDIEFTVEATPSTLTARQFVVKDGVIQQVMGGTIEQDLQ